MATSSPYSPSDANKLRIGYLSTASIGRKNAWAADLSGRVALHAVASRDLAKAQAFANDLGFTRAFGSYEELLADPDVDAVYVPLPTGVRKEWAVKAARAGKHVLMEKPCALSLADLKEVTAACAAAGVFYMDGVMFMHHERLQHMHKYLYGPTQVVGQIRHVSSAFSFAAPEGWENIRLDPVLEPAGSLGDLGWYNIRFTLWALNWESPIAASGFSHRSTAEGVPLEMSATLFYADGRAATFNCSFQTGLRQWVDVAGDQGSLRCDDFVLNRSGTSSFSIVSGPHMTDKHRDVIMPETQVELKVEYGHQESRMWAAFAAGAAAAKAGARDPHWARISLLTQAVLDAVMASIATGTGQRVPVEVDIGDAY